MLFSDQIPAVKALDTEGKYKKEDIEATIEELSALVDEFTKICNESLYPVSFFGYRTKCCCLFRSLFHETK